MPITPLKDILFGEQNAVSVNRRSLPTDDELARRMRTDYASSRDMSDTSGLMTARVIETPAGLVSPPFSWSMLSTQTRTDTKVVVVKAHLIEASVSPSYDEDIKTLDGKQLSYNSLKLLQYEFVGIHSDLPIPTEGDDIWVDFENRKTLTGPRYHGVKNSVSTNGGVNPAVSEAARLAYEKNKAIKDTATGAAALGMSAKPSLSAQLAEIKPGSPVPISPLTAEETAAAAKSVQLESVLQNSAFSTQAELDRYLKEYKEGKRGSELTKHALRTLGTGEMRKHTGVDLSVPYGTPVYAVLNGIVESITEIAQTETDRGIVVSIKYDDPTSMSPSLVRNRYLHLSQVYVAEGTKVAAGQFIARTGEAGPIGVGGPHLHLESYGPAGIRNCTEKEMELTLNAADVDSYVERETEKVRNQLAEFVQKYKIFRQPYFKDITDRTASYIGEQYFSGTEQDYQLVLKEVKKGMVFVEQIEREHGGLDEEHSLADRSTIKLDLQALNEYKRVHDTGRRASRRATNTARRRN